MLIDFDVAEHHDDISDELDNELAHYGILGMRWGVRRSDEELARARGEKAVKAKARSLSDDDLRSAVNRMNLEKQYRTLTTEASRTRGQQYIKQLEKQAANAVVTATVAAGSAYIANRLWPKARSLMNR